jgi:hypothetical protein
MKVCSKQADYQKNYHGSNGYIYSKYYSDFCFCLQLSSSFHGKINKFHNANKKHCQQTSIFFYTSLLIHGKSVVLQNHVKLYTNLISNKLE